MTKLKNIFLCTLLMTISTSVMAALQVYTDDQGCPIEVANDGSCQDGNDRPDVACKNNNGPVRWAPLSAVAGIESKSGAGLHNCKAHPQQGFYQCIVRGNVGDHIEYNVIAPNGCVYDPVLIIR